MTGGFLVWGIGYRGYQIMAAAVCDWDMDFGRSATLDTRSAPVSVLRVSASRDILCIRGFAVFVFGV